MNRLFIRKYLGWLVAGLLALPAPVFAADIIGRITLLTSTTGRFPSSTVVIQGPKLASTSIDKAMLRVTADTKVFRRSLVQGNVTAVPIKFTELQMGQMVEATFAGPVTMTYPVQGTASEIVILDQGLAESGNAAAAPVFPAVKEGEVVTLTGKVQGSLMALGGETTGWDMMYLTPQGLKNIEIDFTGAAGDKPVSSAEFIVTGKIVLKQYVERGPILTLLAAKVEKAAASPTLASPQPNNSGTSPVGNISAAPSATSTVPTGTTTSPYKAQ